MSTETTVDTAVENEVVNMQDADSQNEGDTTTENAAAEVAAPAPKKRATRAAKKVDEETAGETTEAPESEAAKEASDDSDDTAPEEEEAATGAAKPVVDDAERARRNAERRRERERRRRATAALDIDGNPIIDSGAFNEDYALVSQARNTRKIVSGTIDEIRRGRGDTPGWVETHYLGFRVLIPFTEMDITVIERDDDTEERRAARLHTTISNMLGARIDFIINHVEEEGRIATGSRRLACAQKRKDILNATDSEGNYIIYPGRAVQVSVLAVHPEFAFVDVFGFRARLRARDIRSEFTEDVTNHLENGQVVKAYVTNIERDPKTGEVTLLFLSMRNDVEERADLERVEAALQVGDTCRGRVVSRNKKSIFIRLNNGLQAYVLIATGLQGRNIPNVGDSVSVRVVAKLRNRANDNPLIRGRIVRNINHIAR